LRICVQAGGSFFCIWRQLFANVAIAASLVGSFEQRAFCCDGYHKISDSDAAGEPVHRSRDGVAPVWPHQRRLVRAGLMEKIMSKTNDISKLDHAKLENRVLADSELDAVSGGERRCAPSNLLKLQYPTASGNLN
jgi:hypothetical protein